MASSDTMRIVLLGKTGSGKSSLANTMLGETLFETDDSFCSGTRRCQAETKEICGRSVTLIDTPGLFCTDSEEEMKWNKNNIITECAAGLHAFLLVFTLKRFTEQEQAVVDKVCETFSEEALKYTCLVFTHGDDLPEGETMEDFVTNNERLVDLMRRCGGQCHVFDNKYWNNREENDFRSNKFQVRELLKTIDGMMIRYNGRCFTNDMLKEVERKINSEEETIRESSPDMTEEEIRRKARDKVLKTLSEETQGILSSVLFGLLSGLLYPAAVVGGIVGGAVVGGAVGALVGAAVVVGAAEGAGVGAVVGALVGASVVVGAEGGAGVGAAVGAVTGAVVGVREVRKAVEQIDAQYLENKPSVNSDSPELGHRGI